MCSVSLCVYVCVAVWLCNTHQIGKSQPLSKLDPPLWWPVVPPDVGEPVVVAAGGGGAGATGQANAL